MKRIIFKMGVVGVFCLVAACSDDGGSSPLQPVADNDTEISSSGTADENKSSSSTTPSNDKPSSESKGSDSKDTTTIHQQVVITDSSTIAASTYPSSGIFCWNAGCEEKYASSSSTAPKSSETITITVSSDSADPPEVNGDRMTDKRDNKSYKLQNVAGKLWMAENLNYETSNGSYCSTEGGENYCTKYGRYYTYAAARRVCPPGWRLPTEAEVTAADGEVAHEWWSVGGRFKVADGKATEYGMENEQGYIWIEASGDYNSWRVKNYDGDEEHALQSSSETDRGYNVRCVQE